MRTYSNNRSVGWLRVYSPRPGARQRLVCFPYAGGGASAFRGWADLLPPSIELISVQYPGRQDRFGEDFISDLPTLADEIAGALADRRDRPMAFFGHSLGATVAFEVALRLRPRFPTPLVRLFASARKAPADCRPSGRQFLDEAAMKAYVRDLRGDTGPLLDEELWELTAPVLRSDLLMSERYRYLNGSRLSCPITAIVGAADSTVTPADARRWAAHTIGPFDAHVLPGGHFYLDDRPAELVTLLAEKIRGALAAD
jgi:pyochelin biosynthetic protein PchC